MTDEPKHRTNIWLYASDVAYLQRRHGFGWTEKVREMVRAHVKQQHETQDYIRDKIERENPGKGWP